MLTVSKISHKFRYLK